MVIFFMLFPCFQLVFRQEIADAPVRELRWPAGTVTCPVCSSINVINIWHHNTESQREKYLCKDHYHFFGDLIQTNSRNEASRKKVFATVEENLLVMTMATIFVKIMLTQ